MKKLYAVKKDDGQFWPTNQSDKEIWDSLKKNTLYRFDVSRPRNPEFHQLVFACCRCALDNAPEDNFWGKKFQEHRENAEYLFLKAIMRARGYVEIEYDLDGKATLRAYSISFDNMDQEQFGPIGEAIMEECALFLGIDIEDFKKNYKRYL